MFYSYYYLAISCCNYLAKRRLTGCTVLLDFLVFVRSGSQNDGSLTKLFFFLVSRQLPHGQRRKNGTKLLALAVLFFFPIK